MTLTELRHAVERVPARGRCWVVLQDPDARQVAIPLEAFEVELRDGALRLVATVDLAELVGPTPAAIPIDHDVMRIL